jgi:hypothetical protein
VSIARSLVTLLGTSESSGVTIATTANGTSAIIDLLGNNTSRGEIIITGKVTSTVTAGTVDIYVAWSQTSSGLVYSTNVPLVYSAAPINGTQDIVIGGSPWAMIQCARYMTLNVLNNATGANLTNVYFAAELYLYQ